MQSAPRIADRRIRLIRPDGEPAAGLEVQAELSASDFRVGTCVNGLLSDRDHDGARYRSAVRQGFDSLVCENAMKWYAIEKEDGRIDWRGADLALGFAAGMAAPLRGHCLLWSKAKFVQPWVQALSADALRTRVEAHLERMAALGGRVCCWDGINEMLDGDFYGERLGSDANAWIYRRYAESDPRTPLFVNEYGILDSDAKTARYLDLIARLRAQGAPLGGIGIQEHCAERFAADAEAARAEEHRPERQGRGPLIPAEIHRRLDALAATGLPIHLTEISVKTADESRKAACVEALLDTAFAHPAVEQVLFWGFWPQAHWLGREAALLDEAWEELPAWRTLQAWRARLRAPQVVTTNAQGGCALHGAAGVWSIRARGAVVRVHIGAGSGAVEVRLPA
jgi:GH35 family endo-1,4-beta-xylanase